MAVNVGFFGFGQEPSGFESVVSLERKRFGKR